MFFKKVHTYNYLWALRCPYTYESGSRVRLGSGSNESNSSVCGESRAGIHSCVCGEIYPSLAPSQAPQGGLASQTRTCMGTFKGVQISPYFSDCDSGYGFFSVDFLPVCKYWTFWKCYLKYLNRWRALIWRFGLTERYAEAFSTLLLDLTFGSRFASDLTFQSPAVSLRTTRVNIKKFYMVLTLRWVSCTDLRTDSNLCFIRH